MIGDLDGDGRTDLAASNLVCNAVTMILRKNDNTGWEAAAVAGATQDGPFALAVGDRNGDGKPDLVTANANAHSVTVLTNTAAPVSSGSISSAPRASCNSSRRGSTRNCARRQETCRRVAAAAVDAGTSGRSVPVRSVPGTRTRPSR